MNIERKTKKGSAILLVVAGMVFLIILAAVLLVSTKERDLAAHSLVYEQACHEIALSTAKVTLLAFKRSLILQDQWDPRNKKIGKKKSYKDLITLLLRDNKSLIKELSKIHDKGDEQRSKLELLFGKDFFSPIEQGVLPFYKGAKVKVSLHLVPSPLYSCINGIEDYCDPFERNYKVTVCATATWREARRTVVLTKEARVNSLLPPATGKFAFLCREPASDDINSRLCDSEGLSVEEGVEPLWRIFANAEGEALKEKLKNESLSQSESLIASHVANWHQLVGDLSLPSLQEKYSKSGFIYFGPPRFKERTVLKLPAGKEEHLLSCAHFPQEERQKARETATQPLRMESLTTQMRPFVQGLFTPFHKQTMATGLFGPSLTNDQSSRLQLFGTVDNPCPTLVLGPVVSACARVTDMAIDRDREMTDEEEQRQLVGRVLPQRETIDPFFVCADQEEFSQALSRETSYPLRVEPLKPFCSPGLIGEAVARTPEDEPVRIGLLENLNLHADSTGDGHMDLVVSSETAHHPLVVPLPDFGYRNLFQNWEDYCTFSSTGNEQFSFNLLAKTMTMEPTLAFTTLWENRLREPQAIVGSAEARIPTTGTIAEDELKLHFTTKLHQKAKVGPLFDNKRNSSTSLAQLPINMMLYARAIIAMSPKEMKERLLSGTEKDENRELDLRGLTINLAGTLELKPYNDKMGPLTITLRKRYGLTNHMRPQAKKGSKKEYWLNGGGAIVTWRAYLNDLILANEEGDSHTPFVLCASEVDLRAPFYLDALIDGQKTLSVLEPLHYQGKEPPPQQINGCLHMGNSAALRGDFAVDINYDTRFDPTNEAQACHYRGFVSDGIYGWRFGRDSFEETWSRVRKTWDEEKALKKEEKKCEEK